MATENVIMAMVKAGGDRQVCIYITGTQVLIITTGTYDYYKYLKLPLVHVVWYELLM